MMNYSNSLIKNPGEVSAIVGYYKQYEICAVEIYDALRENQLVGVEFASSELCKLDDVLIVCEDYVVAYQIKDLAETFTYNSLINKKEKLLAGSFKDMKYPHFIGQLSC